MSEGEGIATTSKFNVLDRELGKGLRVNYLENNIWRDGVGKMTLDYSVGLFIKDSRRSVIRTLAVTLW